MMAQVMPPESGTSILSVWCLAYGERLCYNSVCKGILHTQLLPENGGVRNSKVDVF
jgi:hypothetical protein